MIEFTIPAECGVGRQRVLLPEPRHASEKHVKEALVQMIGTHERYTSAVAKVTASAGEIAAADEADRVAVAAAIHNGEPEPKMKRPLAEEGARRAIMERDALVTLLGQHIEHLRGTIDVYSDEWRKALRADVKAALHAAAAAMGYARETREKLGVTFGCLAMLDPFLDGTGNRMVAQSDEPFIIEWGEAVEHIERAVGVVANRAAKMGIHP